MKTVAIALATLSVAFSGQAFADHSGPLGSSSATSVKVLNDANTGGQISASADARRQDDSKKHREPVTRNPHNAYPDNVNAR